MQNSPNRYVYSRYISRGHPTRHHHTIYCLITRYADKVNEHNLINVLNEHTVSLVLSSIHYSQRPFTRDATLCLNLGRRVLGRFVSFLSLSPLNALRPRQNGPLFSNIFKSILPDNLCNLVQSSPKSLPNDPIKDKPESAEIMAWCRKSDNSLFEPTMVRFIAAYIRHSA